MKVELDKDVEVEGIDTTEEPEEQLDWDDNDPNLVATFSQTEKGRVELKRIENEIKDTFDREWDAQEARREQIAKDHKTFIGMLSKKTYPFENCANVNVPIAYENIIRLGFRIVGELFGDWTNVVGTLPVGPDDQEAADLLSTHSNWQMTEQIQDFPAQMEKAVFQFLLQGDVTCHSYRDPDNKINRHEILSSDEFLVPNNITSCQPDYSDSPFVCRIYHFTDAQLYAKKLLWEGVAEILEKAKDGEDDSLDFPLKEAHADSHSVTKPDEPTFNQHKILYWVGYMQMPGYERPRFVQGYLHYETGRLLQLSIHEHAESAEIERFERQTQELKAYQAQIEQYTQLVHSITDSETGMMADETVPSAVKMEYSMVGSQLPPAPVAPAWLSDPDDPEEGPAPIEKKPVYQFTHGVLIEPVEGTIGYGFGRLVADLNVAANVLIDQYIDAATVNNTSEIVVTSDVKFKKPFRSRPGAMHTVSSISANDLQRSIMVLPKSTANPQMRELVDTLVRWGQSAPQSPDILSGAPGKSGETFRGISTRSEHATKQLSVIARKFARFVARIYRQNARLNANFMEEQEFFNVNNHRLGMTQQLSIGRALYKRPYSVFFRSDLTFSSQSEKVQKADELVQMALQIPVLAQNPQFIQRAVVKALEARGEHEMADLVKATPPAPPAPAMPPPGQGVPQ